VGLRLVALLEAAGRLDNYADGELPPGEIRWFGDRERPQLELTDGDRVWADLDLFG
jgi:hypothetical protein